MGYAPPRKGWSFLIHGEENADKLLDEMKVINTSTTLNLNEISFIECSRAIDDENKNGVIQGMIVFKKCVYEEEVWRWFPCPTEICRSHAEDCYNSIGRQYHPSTLFKYGKRHGRLGNAWDVTRIRKLADYKKTYIKRRRIQQRNLKNMREFYFCT